MPSIIKKVLWAVGYASAIYKGCHETYNYVVSEPPQYPHQLQTHHDVAEHVTQQLFPSISLTQTSADNNAGGSVSKLGGHTISSVVVDNGIPLEAVVRVDAPLSPEDFHHLNRDCNASSKFSGCPSNLSALMLYRHKFSDVSARVSTQENPVLGTKPILLRRRHWPSHSPDSLHNLHWVCFNVRITFS